MAGEDAPAAISGVDNTDNIRVVLFINGKSVHAPLVDLVDKVASSRYFPAGGATGQYLIKASNADFDTAWDTLSLADITDASANGRSLVSAANYAAMRTLLGLVVGTDVQAYDAQLSSLIRQNSKSAAYTLLLTDGGKHIFHPSADTTARIWTIPANSSVAFPIGTAITFINQNGAGVLTIAITSDTMRLAGAGTTGSRTLAANGMATAVKITTTEWIISGTGLT